MVLKDVGYLPEWQVGGMIRWDHGCCQEQGGGGGVGKGSSTCTAINVCLHNEKCCHNNDITSHFYCRHAVDRLRGP